MEKLKSSENKILRIGIFTSGGDSPGMNAAIRALVRLANTENIEVVGFYEGYNGIINKDYKVLDNRDVAFILHRGGTMLRSSRSDEFRTKEGRKKAFETIQELDIDGLIAIGGDGTLKGLEIFYQEYKIPGIGMPGTIDNDINGTDFTIGFDTARNTVVEAVDRIRDTASSHNRLFFIEVMGRDSGYIALHSAIASGAMAVMLPETHVPIKELADSIQNRIAKGKKANIIIVSEGNKNGNAFELGTKIKEIYPHIKPRITTLGHIQRGGNPTCQDRILAARLASFAIQKLQEGITQGMVGIKNNSLVLIPLDVIVKEKEDIEQELIILADKLTL
jgi:6-phosphofructokinase 1